MDTQPILELKNIQKQYPGVLALSDVSLSFLPGEVHAIVGENGAGKSTLIKVITGAIEPTAGEIHFQGRLVAHQNPIASMEAGIACIYQEFNLVPYLSVMENVFFGSEPVKNGFIDYRQMRERTAAILKELDIEIDPGQTVADLSVGFQQIVEIAKALTREVKVLIMDEPSAPLTNKELGALFAIVRNLREKGVTIIYISHRLEEIFELSNRVTVMRDGQYITTMDTADTDRDGLIKLMVGRDLVDEFPDEDIDKGETIFRVENLNTRLLKHISFEVRRGEILGFAGLVGAGRTETARAVYGADPIDSGRIYIHDKEVRIGSPIDAINNGIGMIPEDRKQHGILALLSIRKNMTYSALPKYIRRGLIWRSKEVTDTRDMKKKLRVKTPNLEVLVSALSGGNQQKVVLAKTLLTDSDIIIFDEPTRGIDVGAKQEIYLLMKNLARAGKAIIMISSEMPELIGMSDRVLIMYEGRIVKELPRARFSQETILRYACGQEAGEDSVHEAQAA